jgi:hypothetical protein
MRIHMKHANRIKLAVMASADVRHGGAKAIIRSNRLKRMGGGLEADEIVTRVYTHPTGRATYMCRECHMHWLSTDEQNACCREEQFT